MDLLLGLASVPYFTLGPWDLGVVTVQGFGLMVAIGVVLGYNLASWKAPKFGLGKDKLQALLLALLICGFVGSHVLDLIFYHPGRLLEDPSIMFKFGGTLSSYGGILGSLLGVVWWKVKYKEPVLPYLDVAGWALPAAWFFGRVGCAVVHDHPGAPSEFFLAVVMKDGVARHDMGFYEAMWWIVIIIVFAVVHLRSGKLFQRRPGFYLALLPLIYAPARFSLDFLRLPPSEGGDARYLGLTPGQYLSICAFLFGVGMMWAWATKKLIQMPPVSEQPEPDSKPQTSRQGGTKGQRKKRRR